MSRTWQRRSRDDRSIEARHRKGQQPSVVPLVSGEQVTVATMEYDSLGEAKPTTLRRNHHPKGHRENKLQHNSTLIS